MTDEHTPGRARDLDIHVTMAAETGYIIQDGGVVVAAFTTAAELCNWLEDKLRRFDPVRTAEPMPRAFAADKPESGVAQLRRGLFSK